MPRGKFRPDSGHWTVDPETDCWNWAGFCDVTRGGYGAARFNGRSMRAHRAVYLELVGEIPDGYDLHHRCGNTRCVNPDHLEPMPLREHRALSKCKRDDITAEDLRSIRELGKEFGVTYDEIAAKVGVDKATVRRTLMGQTWIGEDEGRVVPDRNCAYCGESITEGNRNRAYCNQRCRELFNNQRRRDRRAAARDA